MAANASDQEPAFMDQNLEHCITTAASGGKALLCFVTDGSAISNEWETMLKDPQYRTALQGQIVVAKILSGTQEARYLSNVTSHTGAPAVVIIQAGTVGTNLQHPRATTEDLRTRLQQFLDHGQTTQAESEHVESLETAVKASLSDDAETNTSLFISFSNAEAGRMRLQFNAYDALGQLTQQLIKESVPGDQILRRQIEELRKIPSMTEAIAEIETRVSGTRPTLTRDQQNRLMNTHASVLRAAQNNGASSQTAAARTKTSAPTSSATTTTSTNSTPNDTAANTHLLNSTQINTRIQPHQTQQTQGIVSQQLQQEAGEQQTTNTQQTARQQQQERLAAQRRRQQEQQTQRAEEVRIRRERDASEEAERARIKNSVAADEAKRNHKQQARGQEQRRKTFATSQPDKATTITPPTPKTTDIRVQVRTFDGPVIRSTFLRDATIATHVRPWVDQTAQPTLPYSLKLILTPSPNKTIEVGEEQQSLSDLGIVASATLVMVAVTTSVDSYASATGIVSSVTGALGGALNNLGGLFGWGNAVTTTAASSTPPTSSSSAGAATSPFSSSTTTANSSAPRAEIPRSAGRRVRTLADQRAEEAAKGGNELYNGNQLNFQGRKDGDDKEKEG